MDLDLEIGKRIGHVSYGLRTVVRVSDSGRFTVEFDSGITWHGIDREQIDAFYDPAEFERARRAAEEIQNFHELLEKASADPLPVRVSITPPPPGDRVGRRLIDVKNARRSEKNPDRYVSHCVAGFKERRHLEAVKVAGTVSHWLTVAQIISGPKPVLFWA